MKCGREANDMGMKACGWLCATHLDVETNAKTIAQRLLLRAAVQLFPVKGKRAGRMGWKRGQKERKGKHV